MVVIAGNGGGCVSVSVLMVPTATSALWAPSMAVIPASEQLETPLTIQHTRFDLIWNHHW